MPHISLTNAPNHSRSFAHVFVLIAVASFLLLSPISPLFTPASSDPGYVDNGDDTRSIFWNFTNPADYDVLNTTVTDGKGMLDYVNESIVDNTSAMFDLGTKVNIDSSSFVDALAIDDPTLPVTNSVIQFELDLGEDLRVEMEWPAWNTEGTTLSIDSEVTRELRSFIRFNLSSIPSDAVIVNASMALWLSSGKPALVDFGVYPLNSSWNASSASWSRIDATHYWAHPGGDYATEAFYRGTMNDIVGWKTMDVSRLVDLWVHGVVPNNGVVLVPVPAAGDGEKTFISCHDKNDPEKRPKITVNYTLAPATGVFESQVLGMGTNATFTYAKWTHNTTSRASDEFSGPSLSETWSWMNDPSLSGGSFNFDTPGWLNITGSPSTDLVDRNVTGNLLFQAIAGNFSAYTSVNGRFTDNSMGAGILLYCDSLSWLALVKSATGVDGSVMTIVCEGGTSRVLTNTYWGTSDSAHLRVDRNATSFQMFASLDGLTWTLVAVYDPPYGTQERLLIGPYVFSGGSASTPMAEFDFFRISPDGQTPELMMRVRTGNSTLLTDPSWGPWGSPISPSTGATVGLTGRYIQYQVTLATWWEWLTPLFSGFECYEEGLLDNGMITTFEVNPVDLQVWQSMEVTQYVENGSVEYFISTDQGGSWTSLGFGTSFALTQTVPSMTVRAVLRTYDTLTTPTIDTIELRYAVSVSWLQITAPAVVTAGQDFEITVQAMDPSDNIATTWTGDIVLHALDSTGSGPSSSELYRTLLTVVSGERTIYDQRYDVAEIIRISVNAGGAWGLSIPITVQPGPVASITINPGDDTMLEHSSLGFTATAFDSVGNEVTGAQFTWAAEQSLGMLNTVTGVTVVLTAGDYDTGGYLSVTSAGVTATRMISVLPSKLAPTFDSPLPDQIRAEDYGEWSLDITSYVSDAEDLDSMLRWYATNESAISVRGENRTGSLIITFSTIRDAFGTNILNLFVVDSDGMRTSAPLKVIIEEVNDAPTIAHIEPLVVHYEIPYTYDFQYYVSDPDDPLEDLVLTVGDESAPYTTIAGFLATFNFPASMMGTNHTVIVMVTDPGLLSATVQVVISVTDDNVPEQLDPLPSLTLNQGVTLVDCVYLPDYFDDPEGDVLYYASGYAHVIIEIKPDHYVNVTGPEDWFGIEYVIIQATDPDGARVEGVLQVTVLAVNKPPMIEGVPDLMVKHDERYEFDIYPYINDPDGLDDLLLSADDSHCTFMGSVMVVLYPMAMLDTVNPVTITVAEEDASDSCQINITVTDNSPPRARAGYPLPDHSFQEDLPMQYPITQGLEYYFSDEEDTEVSNFSAFALSPDVAASAFKTNTNVWKVGFTTSANYYGSCGLVLRAIDTDGAVTEEMVNLQIIPIADAPSLDLPDSFTVVEGQQMILNLKDYVSDPDSFFENSDFSFDFRMVTAIANSLEYEVCINLLPGAIVFQYPNGFLSGHVGEIVIEISVTDESAKVARDEIHILIQKAPATGEDNPWLWLAVAAAIVGGGSGMIGVAWVRRKEPFVVLDLMLIHNDGFLISRYSHHHEGEIDENILSGMLTAVLGFVEDSMSSQHDDLKSFGFKDYKVAVERGEKCFAAVVYEGEAPEKLDKSLKEFLGTVERIYRKKLVHWTGDIDTDFAGMEVLMGAWVKDNSRKGTNGDTAIWKAIGEKPRKKVKPKKVQVDMISGQQTGGTDETADSEEP